MLAKAGGKRPDGEPLALPGTEVLYTFQPNLSEVANQAIQAYYWAVDIYDAEETRDEVLASLKGNRDDPYKADSDGENLLKILNELQAQNDEKKKVTMKPSNFERWIHSDYGIKGSQSSRILSLMRSSFWSSLWASYVQTPYGVRHFNFTTADEITNTKLETVRMKRICLSFVGTRLTDLFSSFGRTKSPKFCGSKSSFSGTRKSHRLTGR